MKRDGEESGWGEGKGRGIRTHASKSYVGLARSVDVVCVRAFDNDTEALPLYASWHTIYKIHIKYVHSTVHIVVRCHFSRVPIRHFISAI